MFLRAQPALQRCNRKQESFFGRLIRDALLGILVTSSVPIQAAEPIRIPVIPYRARSKEIQVPPLLPPPPLLLVEPVKPRKRRPHSGRDNTWDDDLEWLMDESKTSRGQRKREQVIWPAIKQRRGEPSDYVYLVTPHACHLRDSYLITNN